MRALLRSCVHVSSCPACGLGFYCVNSVRTAVTTGYYGLPEATPTLFSSQAGAPPAAVPASVPVAVRALGVAQWCPFPSLPGVQSVVRGSTV